MNNESAECGGAVQQQEELDYEDDWVISGVVDGEEFEQFLSTVDAIVDEAKFVFSREGIETSAVDPANVSLVETRVSADGFDRQAAVGVNVKQLRKKVEDLDPVQRYDIEVDSRAGLLKVSDPHHTDREIELIEPGFIRDEPTYPDLDFENQFTTESYRLKGKIGAIAEEAESVESWGRVKLTPMNGEILVEGRANTSDDWEYRWPMEADVEAGESNTWSGSFLGDVIKGLPNGVDVDVRFGPDVPMELEVGDSLMFAIAPTITRNGGDD